VRVDAGVTSGRGLLLTERYNKLESLNPLGKVLSNKFLSSLP